MCSRARRPTRRDILCFILGCIVTHFYGLNMQLRDMSTANTQRGLPKDPENSQESKAPEKPPTLTDECLQKMDPEKLNFQQISKIRTEDPEKYISKQHSTFLLTLIMTGPHYSDRRQVLRDTWLSKSHGDRLHYFVIGTKNIPKHSLRDLTKENQKYKDLLLLSDFEDSYDNLSQKLLHMVTWAYDHIDFKFLFKADDDTFANLDKMYELLQDEVYDPNLYWGYFYGKGSVKRSGQWAEHDWFLCEHYLPNARGGGYVISRELAGYVARNSKLLQTYKSEDITLGTWMAPLNIKRHHDVRFDTEFKSRGCHNSWIVTHKQSMEDLKEKWEHYKFTAGEEICRKEVSLSNGYEYRWDAPNRECCVPHTSIP